jgi:hypothetical protein
MEWVVGDEDSGESVVLGSVQDVAILDDGSIAILDGLERRIVLLGPDGDVVRSFGRRGAGPGEFEQPLGIAADHSGRLWIADHGTGRYAVWDTTGALSRTVPRPPTGMTGLWKGVYTRNHLIYEPARIRRGVDAATVLLGIDTLGVPVDTVALPEYQTTSIQLDAVFGGTRTRLAVREPFTPWLVWSVSPDGTVTWGVNADYAIHFVSLGGDTLRVVRNELRPVPVTDSERAYAVEDLQIAYGAVVRAADLSSHVRPYFSALLLDDSGRLWVRITPGPGRAATEFDAFDASGRYVGRISAGTPIGEHIAIRGSVVVGSTIDSLGTPRVFKARIAETAGR